MPDLGEHAGAVLASYGLTALVLIVICGLTWRAAVKSNRALEEAEARLKNG